MAARDDESDKVLGQRPVGKLIDGQVADHVVDAIRGLPSDEASAFAAQIPTVSEPTSPGPAATAIASTSARVTWPRREQHPAWAGRTPGAHATRSQG